MSNAMASIALFDDGARYPGGKGADGVYQRIICQLPPHEVYIEPFLGGGAILRHKKAARLSIGIDKDAEVIAQWRSLADSIAKDGDGGRQFICGDSLAWLAAQHFTGSELVYCDPPYVISTLSSGRAPYKHWLTDSEHERLLSILLGLPCMVAISGYMSELYADLLAGWRLYQFEAVTRSGRMATECLWMNYPAPARLHDYRYLGESFRERERIKRKKQRWVSRLQRMDQLERMAILAAIDEVLPYLVVSPDMAMAPELTEGAAPIASPDTTMRACIAISDDRAGSIAVNGDALGEITGERCGVASTISPHLTMHPPAGIAINGDGIRKR